MGTFPLRSTVEKMEGKGEKKTTEICFLDKHNETTDFQKKGTARGEARGGKFK